MVSINSNVGVKEKADVTTLIAVSEISCFYVKVLTRCFGTQGDYFGEGSLLSNEPANANVVADGGEGKRI